MKDDLEYLVTEGQYESKESKSQKKIHNGIGWYSSMM